METQETIFRASYWVLTWTLFQLSTSLRSADKWNKLRTTGLILHRCWLSTVNQRQYLQCVIVTTTIPVHCRSRYIHSTCRHYVLGASYHNTCCRATATNHWQKMNVKDWLTGHTGKTLSRTTKTNATVVWTVMQVARILCVWMRDHEPDNPYDPGSRGV